MNTGHRSASPEEQRRELLDSERKANRDQPRNFKEDAITDKRVSVEPDGTGPTPTDTFDPQADQAAGSGSPAPPEKPARGGTKKQTGDR